MKQLQKALGAAFGLKAKSRPDRVCWSLGHMKKRIMALSTEIGADVEPVFEAGGWNVWPPEAIGPSLDPYDGDHYAISPRAVLEMLERYKALVS